MLRRGVKFSVINFIIFEIYKFILFFYFIIIYKTRDISLYVLSKLLGRRGRGRSLHKPGKGHSQRRAVLGESLLGLTAEAASLGLSMDP